MVYRFEDFTLDTARRELHRGDALVTIEPQVFDLLEYLIRNRQRVVSKNDIFAAVWNGRIVSDTALTTRLNATRNALADDGTSQRLIRTIRSRGVRFIGEVRERKVSTNTAPEVTEENRSEPPVPTMSVPDKPSIAVLPLSNLSSDREQDYLADGFAEEIIATLSHIGLLFVIARSSSFTYKNQPIDVTQVGRELGVQYLLQGSIRRQSDQVRVSVQLVRTDTSTQIWEQKYDRADSDIFAIQDEIAEAVAGAIEPEINASEFERVRRRAPVDLNAWGLFQRGWWHFLQQNGDNYDQGRGFFRSASQLEPTFAAPRAALAILNYMAISRMWKDNPDTLSLELFEEASLAVALDANYSHAHLALGLAYLARSDSPRALGEIEVALALNPSSSIAHWGLGAAFIASDRFEEAIKQVDTAMRLSPRDPRTWQNLTFKASALHQLHRYEETIECAREATQHPTSDLNWPYFHLAGACAHSGRMVEAAAAIEELLRRRPGLTVSTLSNWPNMRRHSKRFSTHLLDGLRKAGLPE